MTVPLRPRSKCTHRFPVKTEANWVVHNGGMRITFPHTFLPETESAIGWLSCSAQREMIFSIDECLYLVCVMAVVLTDVV